MLQISTHRLSLPCYHTLHDRTLARLNQLTHWQMRQWKTRMQHYNHPHWSNLDPGDYTLRYEALTVETFCNIYGRYRRISLRCHAPWLS
jgi:hypothetical protein